MCARPPCSFHLRSQRHPVHMQVWVFSNEGLRAMCIAFRGTEQVKWKDLLTGEVLPCFQVHPMQSCQMDLNAASTSIVVERPHQALAPFHLQRQDTLSPQPRPLCRVACSGVRPQLPAGGLQPGARL